MLDKRTVVRVGGGTYYEPFPGQLLHDLYTGGGGTIRRYYDLAPDRRGRLVFPKPLPSTAPSDAQYCAPGPVLCRGAIPQSVHDTGPPRPSSAA